MGVYNRTVSDMNEKKTVIFLHVPKTGGSTLGRLIRGQFDKSVMYRIDSPPYEEKISSLRELPVSDKQHIELLLGHMPFGLHSALPQPSTYITMLRNPIDRVLSFYYFVLEDKKHPLHAIVSSPKVGLEALLESNITVEAENGQTRILCGMEGVEWHGQRNTLCPSQALTAAKQNLTSSFDMVGLTERFDEALILLKIMFGWDLPLNYKKVNVTRKRLGLQDISKKHIRLIEKYNEYDIELYEHAKKLFEEQARAAGSIFARKYYFSKITKKYHRTREDARNLVRRIIRS